MVLTSVSHKGIVPTLCISPVLVFHHCDTTSEENSLKEKGLFLAHGFGGFSSQSAGSLVLRLWWSRASWRGRKHGEAKVLIVWLPGREEDREANQTQPMSLPRVHSLPQVLSSCFHHLPMTPSNYDFLSGMVHRWSHDVVTSWMHISNPALNTMLWGPHPQHNHKNEMLKTGTLSFVQVQQHFMKSLCPCPAAHSQEFLESYS